MTQYEAYNKKLSLTNMLQQRKGMCLSVWLRVKIGWIVPLQENVEIGSLMNSWMGAFRQINYSPTTQSCLYGTRLCHKFRSNIQFEIPGILKLMVHWKQIVQKSLHGLVHAYNKYPVHRYTLFQVISHLNQTKRLHSGKITLLLINIL